MNGMSSAWLPMSRVTGGTSGGRDRSGPVPAERTVRAAPANMRGASAPRRAGTARRGRGRTLRPPGARKSKPATRSREAILRGDRFSVDDSYTRPGTVFFAQGPQNLGIAWQRTLNPPYVSAATPLKENSTTLTYRRKSA